MDPARLVSIIARQEHHPAYYALLGHTQFVAHNLSFHKPIFF